MSGSSRGHSKSLTTSQCVKYSCPVHIVTRKYLSEAIKTYPDAANEVKTCVSIVKTVRWHNFEEVRSTFKDADLVDDYVIFDIRHNRYRLVTVIHYAKMPEVKPSEGKTADVKQYEATDIKETKGHIYIRSFLTHKEYDNRSNWDKEFGTK